MNYDLYGQALSKLQRWHERDIRDVNSMLQSQMIETGRLLDLFAQIEPQLIRFPAIDPATFRATVLAFCHSPR